MNHRRLHLPNRMSRSIQLAAIVLLLAGGSIATAQEAGLWRAQSANARSITGDVGLSSDRITIDFFTFTMARIRALEPAEMSAAFDADASAPGTGNLYRVSIASSKQLLRHNTLCGSDDTQWMATYIVGRTLHLTFFSGATPPVFTLNALANSSDLCNTFTYTR